ncbi:hypothetical protein BAE44_0013653 [Dichanthelium oligosanthes]|uniref:Uncharacterized protein n=1 Tax=Dichanthelium oligosanthes TaxID=888268 RepID=A0A1E5VJM8_9POAL|nr:hypothetical protein BAE44_0013653 [Dichanthelium oligosanthes]
MSYIESDKLSLPEVMEHLKDHYKPSDPILLHWLFPSKQLVDGLRALVDDKSCKDMSHYVKEVLQTFMLRLLLWTMKRWRKRTRVTGR